MVIPVFEIINVSIRAEYYKYLNIIKYDVIFIELHTLNNFGIIVDKARYFTEISVYYLCCFISRWQLLLFKSKLIAENTSLAYADTILLHDFMPPALRVFL